MSNDVWSITTGVPLLLCSAVALALIIERYSYVLRCKGLGAQTYHSIITALTEKNTAKALEIATSARTGYQAAVQVLAEHQQSDKTLRDEAVKIALLRHANLLKRRLSGLTTIAALAPMLGLLGTIIGLMRSFHDIGLNSGPVEPAIIADGLWQALSTTAAGMVIAVSCVLFHALIQSRIRRHLAQATDLLNHLSHTLHADTVKVSEPQP